MAAMVVLRERPVQLRLAVLAALLALATDVWSLIAAKPLLGSGWVFFACFSMLKYMIALFWLALAYNGRAWVRYAYVVVTLASVYLMSRVGPEAFQDLSDLLYLAFSVTAIFLWFSPQCQAWYREPMRQPPNTSLERTHEG
jgi:hypothetical protein